MGALDQDEVPKSEAFDKDAELGAHLLGKTVKSSPFEKSVTLPPASFEAGFGYNANKRPYRDGAFSITLAAFTTATVCVGIFAAFNYNPDFFRVGSARYNNSSKGCKIAKGFLDAPSFSILETRTWTSHISADAKTALYVYLATLILSAPLACSLLWVLRKHTKRMLLSVPFMVGVLLATIVLVPVSCAVRGAFYDSCVDQVLGRDLSIYIIVVTFACFFVSVMWYRWDNIELSLRVIGTASEVLHKNLGLLLVLPALRMTFFLYLLPTYFAMLLAYANGKIVLNPKLARYLNDDLEIVCGLLGESCCVWETDLWVPAYLILSIFAVLWGLIVLNEVDVYTISGTISQWYFGAAQSSSRVNLGAVNRSVGHALGPSFGTVCFAGLALAPTRNLRRAVESSRKKNMIARVLYQTYRDCILSAVPCFKFMTIFTTDFAAITGEGFCASASMSCDLLKRNFLSTAVVANTVPRRLLMMFAFLSSAVYGVLVWGVLNLFVQNGVYRWKIAYSAFVLLFLVLAICVRIPAHVVDALYICYAIDKDNNEVSKPIVHDVYVLLPPSADRCIASLVDSKVLPKSA